MTSVDESEVDNYDALDAIQTVDLIAETQVR